MGEHVSIGRAILIGALWVTLPSALLLLAGFAAVYIWTNLTAVDPTVDIVRDVVHGIITVAGYAAAFALGWLWWSFTVTKWRIWAIERTGDWPGLERAAIRAGIIWNDRRWFGRLFARTEIASAADRRKLAELKGGAAT
ncbi:MAG TPA: hypothetical protein VKS60_11370 [Stellaceae bacterium]|nr:hypothetical protein [Stellaceae bacterium]